MASSKRIFEITLSSVTQNGVSCRNFEVDVEKTYCADITCQITKSNGETYLKVSVPEGCEPECIYATLRCTDSLCTDCPNSERIKICPCTSSEDCDECEICVDGLCVSTCPDGQVCDSDRCVDCTDDEDCPANQVCVSGRCECPPNLPLLNDRGICVACLDDDQCGPCEICTSDGCVPVECPQGVCNPDTGGCVDCINSGDCDGDNECCVDNSCDCCPGFTRDAQGNCVLGPECQIDGDCEECEICVDGVCQPIICPEGYVCVSGVCQPICDCSDPTCGRSGACIALDDTTCYCSECTGDCDSNSDCGEGCYCRGGQCVPNPCADTPCNNGEDCAEGCGCLDGTCVPCDSLDCTTLECGTALGCNCFGGTCADDPDPCASFTCDEVTGPSACEGGTRPDCGCDGNGNCVQQPCDGDFQLEKGDCELSATLTSNQCCSCPDVTLIAEVRQQPGGGYTQFSTSIRKGSASSLGSATDLPQVDEVSNPSINGNEEPLSGTVCVDAYYIYEVAETDANGQTIVRRVAETQQSVKTIVLDGLGQAVVQNTGSNIVRSPGQTYNAGALISTRLVFRVCEDITFANECTYTSGAILLDRTFTSDIPSNLAQGFKTLSSDGCTLPTFFWTKGAPTSSGAIAWESEPFRKVYVPLTAGAYVDFINKPDANPAFATGNGFDNRGELWSGYSYRVSTDCGCAESASYQACGGVGRLVFCDPDETPDITFNSCNEIVFNTTWSTDCVVNYDQYNDNGVPVPLNGQLEYGIYVNGSSTPIGDSFRTASSNGDIYDAGQTFVSAQTIEYIELRWSHDDCDECTIRIENDNPQPRDLAYEITCAALASGSVQYTIEVDFGLITNSSTDEVRLNVNNIVLTPSNPSATFIAEPSANIIASVNYEDCGGQYQETIDLPSDCCGDVSVVFSDTNFDCTTAEDIVEVSASAVPSGLTGSYVYTVTGNGNSTTFTDPTLSSGESGVSVTRTIYGDSPQIEVDFTPSGDCDSVNSVTTVNFIDVATVVRDPRLSNTQTLCDDEVAQVNYDMPSGYEGNVTYSVCGAVSTIFVADNVGIIIDVPNVPGTTCVVEIISSDLQPISGVGCPAVFDELVTEFVFVEAPAIFFSFPPSPICQGSTYQVQYSSNVAGTLSYLFNGRFTEQLISGSGLITLDTSVAGTYTFQPTLFVGGTCSARFSPVQSELVVINPQDRITVIENSSTGNGEVCSVSLSILSLSTPFVTPPANTVIGDTYMWNNLPTGTVINMSTNGVCPATESYTVDCDCPTVEPPVAASSAEFCPGDTGVNLTATPAVGDTVLWSTGATTNTIFATTGEYTVRSVNDEGCFSEAVSVTVSEGTSPTIQAFSISGENNGDVCESGTISWSTNAIIPAGLSSVSVTVDGVEIGTTLNGTSSNPAALGARSAQISIVDNNSCSGSETAAFTVVDCCQEITTNITGTFDSCIGSSNSGEPNGDVLCSGASAASGSPDTWEPPLAAFSGATPNSQSGLAAGMVASNQGNIFAGAGAWEGGESLSLQVNVQAGLTYSVCFEQANAGNGSTAIAAAQTQVGDAVAWSVIFNGQVQNSTSLTYQGEGNQTWSDEELQFTATTTGPITVQFRAISPSGIPTNVSPFRYYAAIDNIVIKENC